MDSWTLSEGWKTSFSVGFLSLGLVDNYQASSLIAKFWFSDRVVYNIQQPYHSSTNAHRSSWHCSPGFWRGFSTGMGFNLYILESIDFLHLHKNCWKPLNKYLFQSFQSTIFGLWSLNVAGKVHNNDTTRVPHLKDHPRTCKRFITMVCFRPLRIGLWDPFHMA